MALSIQSHSSSRKRVDSIRNFTDMLRVPEALLQGDSLIRNATILERRSLDRFCLHHAQISAASGHGRRSRFVCPRNSNLHLP